MRENVFMAYLDQATLSLTGAEHYLPWLLAVCKALEAAFGFVSARLLVDPEDGRLLASESDVLMLQLLGNRRLTLMRPLQGLPVSAPRPKALLEATLGAGDVLYLPAGLEGRPCTPCTGPESIPNVYILLTLQSAELSVGFSLCRYLGDLLLQKENLSAEADAFFRSAMTRRTRDDLAKPELGESVQRHARELLSKATVTDLQKHFESRIQQMRQEQLESAGEVRSLPPLEPMVLSRSLLRLAQGVRCKCDVGESRALFTRGADTMTLNIAVTASAMLARLSDGKTHHVDSLPCDDPVERVCVCNVRQTTRPRRISCPSGAARCEGASEQRKLRRCQSCSENAAAALNLCPDARSTLAVAQLGVSTVRRHLSLNHAGVPGMAAFLQDATLAIHLGWSRSADVPSVLLCAKGMDLVLY